MDCMSNNRDSRSDGDATTSIHVLAVDEMLVANSLLTAALLVGISITSPFLAGNSNNSLLKSSCSAGGGLARNLIVFEVFSFSFFLFSTIIALGLKHVIHFINSKDQHEAMKARVNINIVKFGLIGSAIGTIVGGIFFVLAIVNVILIKLCE